MFFCGVRLLFFSVERILLLAPVVGVLAFSPRCTDCKCVHV